MKLVMFYFFNTSVLHLYVTYQQEDLYLCDIYFSFQEYQKVEYTTLYISLCSLCNYILAKFCFMDSVLSTVHTSFSGRFRMCFVIRLRVNNIESSMLISNFCCIIYVPQSKCTRSGVCLFFIRDSEANRFCRSGKHEQGPEISSVLYIKIHDDSLH